MNITEHLVKRIQDCCTDYLNDLRAMDHALLDRSPGGVARSPYDFTYEIVFINKRIAKRLRGEDPGPYKFEGWMSAPAEFRNKEHCIAEVESSTEEVVAALSKVGDADLEREIALPTGSTSPLQLANMAASHLNYHDAQLNYIQAINGDGEMHWE